MEETELVTVFRDSVLTFQHVMQHFWHQKHIFGFSTSAGVLVEEKPNAFREMLGDETSRKFPAMFCQIWFDWMSGHLKGCLWWQNWVFLTRPQDLSTGVHGRRTPDIFDESEHLYPCLWRENQGFLSRPWVNIHPCLWRQNLITRPWDIISYIFGNKTGCL